MARKYDITNIIDPVKAPFTKRSLTHLNTALDDLSRQLIESTFVVAYTTNDIVILEGCEVTANIPGTSSVTAGKIYYNGRIYDVDANASISSPSDTLYWQIATTYISGDPATFSDGNNYNFHVIEKFELVNGTSGGGLGDYDAATIKYKIRTERADIGTWNIDGTGTVSVATPVSLSKVINIDLLVWSDDNTIFRNKNYNGTAYTVSYSGSNIIITDGGIDTGTNWDDSVSNRGYLYITWGDI